MRIHTKDTNLSWVDNIKKLKYYYHDRKEESKTVDNEDIRTLTSNKLVKIDVKEKDFQTLMNVYEMAMIQVKTDLEEVKNGLYNYYNYNVINKIDCRIKTPKSIINKMKMKEYGLNYKNLIEKVDDIAGIRIVCPFKSDISKVVEILEEHPDLEIVEEKNYINKPKKSGYSGYHIIAKTPVKIGDTFANVKTEIQVRTMAMDFWSTTEHKIKYKAKNNLSKTDSIKMVKYAKLINKLDDRIMKIHDKYEVK